MSAALAELKDKIKAALGSQANEDGAGALKSGSAREQRIKVRGAPLRGHFGKINAIDWSSQEQLLSASQDGKMLVWDAQTGLKANVVQLGNSYTMSCAFEKEENTLVAAGGLTNACAIYRLTDDNDGVITKATKTLNGHDGYLADIVFAGKGTIISASGDSTAKEWDVQTGKQVRSYDRHSADCQAVSLNPSNPNVFLTSSCDTTVRMWDRRDANPCEFTFFDLHDSDVNSVKFFPDGKAFGTGSDDSTCKLVDLRSYQTLKVFSGEKVVNGVSCVEFSTSGRALYATYDAFDGVTVEWDVLRDSEHESIMSGSNTKVSALKVNQSGSALATGSWDTFVRLFC